MRILLASSAIIPSGGGIASYNQELIKAIAPNNEIDVITEEIIDHADNIKNVISIYGRNINDFDYCKELVEHINNSKYNLIINSNSKLISIICPYLTCSIVSVSHFVNGKIAIIAGYNAQYIQKIIALSYYGKQFIEKKYKIIDSCKVNVVYNFVHQINTPLNSQKIEKKPIKIVYPGGTSIQKNFDTVMKALRMLIKNKSIQFSFIWLGGMRLPSARFCLPKDVSCLVRDDERVTFTGTVKREEAIKILSETNIFLLPSRGEGCPMTLLEAMQFGCVPVVSDAHHGSREILEDGKFGFITKNSDAKDLYSTLLKILRNHSEYTDNYRQTFEYSRTNLSKEIWQEQMQKLIEDSIKGSKEVSELTKSNFKKNVRKLNLAIRIERTKEQLRSLKSCIICNWLYLTRFK